MSYEKLVAADKSGARKMETGFWILLCIVAVIVLTIRLAFVFPEKAHKPIFWVVSVSSTIILGIIAFLIIRHFDL